MNRPTRSLIPFALLVLAACGSSTSSTVHLPATTEVALDRDFVLAPGQSARIPAESLSIRFDSVTADSRCAEDVVCVWAGDAAVHLTLTRGAAAPRTIVLHTTLQPRSVTDGGVEIALGAVTPATHSGRIIRPADYRVQLRAS